VADWDPGKHPRDLRDGQFTESWATAISDQIAGAVGRATSSPNLPRLQPGGGLPADTPADGRVDTIADLADATAHLDSGGHERFEGIEFYVGDVGWVNADEARLLPTTRVGPNGQLSDIGPTIVLDNSEMTIPGGLGGAVDVSLEGKARWRHADIRPVNIDQPPNPDWEYLVDFYDESEWIDAPQIDVADGEWVYDGEILTAVLGGRPMIDPPEMEGLHTHPQKTTVGARLLDNLPAWTGGGYQIYNPDTGTWHTIEEIYQDNPDEEEIELIADGYHLPHLDTSDEIIVRPIPVGD